MENTKIKMYSDGGARNNPGHAGIGVVIYDQKNNIIGSISEYIGETTNNQAEYTALLAGLERLVSLKISEVNCYLDSELVVKQLNGEYKVKDDNLRIIYLQILELKEKFTDISFIHVKRNLNKVADKLVNEAIDEYLAKNKE